jgi:hypothetical protein
VADASDKLREMLMGFAVQVHIGVRRDELQEQVAPYATSHSLVSRTVAELSTRGISDELIHRSRRYGVLVPDLMLKPTRYRLAPTLDFLTARG